MQNALNVKSTVSKIALITPLTLYVISSAYVSNAYAGDITGNVRLLAGQKRLDNSDWSTLDRQGEVGVMFDIKREAWPVSIAIDVIGSGDDTNNSDLEIENGYTLEQHFGIRKIWSKEGSRFHRYLGGGLAVIHGGLEQRDSAGGEKDDDRAVGVWAGAGAYWDLTEKFNLGFDVRYSQADIDVFGREINAGGVHNSITIGYTF